MNDILKEWSRLGVIFNVDESDRTPDIEKLLVKTAYELRGNSRLFVMALSWLCIYQRFVCKHRLASFARKIEDSFASASLGLLLDMAKEYSGSDHFNLAIKFCRGNENPEPLFLSDNRNPALAGFVQSRSCSLAIKWGLWCEETQIKVDSIRPLSWIMKNNPALKQRAIFNGNLKASILETIADDQKTGESESLLAKCCSATRKAVREALDHLEFCQMIRRVPDGSRIRIEIV
ncbi:MAG: hypothetical protein ACIAQZ_12575 [Sedimentisphaeraceae bacterium JB056]